MSSHSLINLSFNFFVYVNDFFMRLSVKAIVF